MLLLCGGRGCCGTTFSCTSGNGCRCGQREPRCGGRREKNDDRDRRGEQEKSCGCEEMRPEPRKEEKDNCDIVNTIPQSWQEYAKRDTDNC